MSACGPNAPGLTLMLSMANLRGCSTVSLKNSMLPHVQLMLQVQKAAGALADFFFPPQCLLCRRFIGSYRDGHFCKQCLAGFAFTGSPLCVKCGILFTSRQGEDHLCSRCIRYDRFFDTARAVGSYEGVLRKTVHEFKYRGRSMLAAPLGRLMAEQGSRLLALRCYDLLAPVPLHVRRLRERGYNQAGMLANVIGKAWGIPVNLTALRKRRSTAAQTELTADERRKNIRGAFFWAGASLAEKSVLLVDDVYTSGATADECARVLKRAGAARVDVFTLARTQ